MTARQSKGSAAVPGTVVPRTTASGARVWQAQWRERGGDGRRVRRARTFPSEVGAQEHLTRVKLGLVEPVPSPTQAPPHSPPTSRAGATGGTASCPTFEDWASDWFEVTRLAPSTLADYRRKWRLHIAPTLGRKPLDTIRPLDLARLYRALERGRAPHQQRQLGPNTVRKVHELVSAMLRDALVEGRIETNVATNSAASPPTQREIRAAKRDIVVWAPRTVNDFLHWIERDEKAMELAAIWRLALASGLRRGELSGLRWADIDLTNGIVHVRRAITPVTSKGEPTSHVIGMPKGGSARVVSIDAETAAALDVYRGRRALLGKRAVAPGAWVSTQVDGTQAKPDYLTRRFRLACDRFVDRYPVEQRPERIRLHDLRHTLASLLLAAGVDAVTVSKRLGHATVGITLDVYAHIVPGRGGVAAEAWNTLVRSG